MGIDSEQCGTPARGSGVLISPLPFKGQKVEMNGDLNTFLSSGLCQVT